MKKKILAIILATGMVLSAGLTGCGSDTGSATSAEDDSAAKAAEISEEVQNGYLGNYDTVTVKEVIEYLYAGGEWTYGTSNDGTYYVVDYCNEDYVEIQFAVYDDGSETFTVSGMDLFTDDTDSYSSSGVAAFLNSIYRSYINAYPECGLTAVSDDEMADEAVLDGHFGPVRSVEESEDMESDASQTEETMPEEEAIEDSETEAEPIEIIYGVYEYDNGSDNVMTAEVGFASDSDADYIYIDALGYGGHYTVNYSGTLYEQISDGSYPSDNEWGETRIYVTFYEDGMRVQVSSTDDESYYVLDGYYTLTEELDLDQVS